MNQFDDNLTKSLEDFMENYKMVDVDQIYSNGTEFVPIFRVKQWLEYNNINNLQSKIDKANRILNANTYVENIYYALSNLFDEEHQYEIDNDELNNILKEDK